MQKHIFFGTVLILICCGYSYAPGQPIQKVDSVGVNRLPSIPFLPDPLVLGEKGANIPIKTMAQWKQKRQWIKKEYQYWISGSVPPPPKTVHVKTLSVTSKQGVEERRVQLRFGPGDEAKMTVELMIPVDRQGSLPVFMTQWNHRAWARLAVRRGYIGCVYAGADAKDDTRNYRDLYPDYDFATLMRRAWGASRVVDYLYRLPAVDTARIALTGHSRNGKQSLMAAAFDKRIDAVVSSSGGTGGESTFRYSDNRFDSESLEEITRNFPNWFDSRLRWFVGSEQKLPVDQNSLMALIAPRGLMMASAITESQGNPWGIEQSYKSVRRAYHFLDADSAIALWLRRGRHQHAARTVEKYIDFFDYLFGRSPIAPENNLYYDYSFKKWKHLSGEHIDPLDFPVASNEPTLHFTNAQSFAGKQDSIRKQIRWLLGARPPGVMGQQQFSSMLGNNSHYKDDYLSEVIGEPDLPENIKEMKFGPYSPLGDDLWGTMYFPSDAIQGDSVATTLPLVIYLHESSYATGYHRRSASAIRRFIAQGYAVLAFDMMGFGTRIQEALHFYDRYPHWSELGKMVTDVRSVISDAGRRMPFIDSDHIYLTGYSLGGTVALVTAALDRRVKGVAAVSGFSSLRRDNKGTEGIRHYSHMTGLLPRLGFFLGHEDRIPIDFEDILAAVAPRPVLVIAPEGDRNHSTGKVKNTVKAASKIFMQMHVPKRLTFKHPDTYSHFTNTMQKQVAVWLLQQKK